MRIRLLLILLLLSPAFAQVSLPAYVKLTRVNLTTCNKPHDLLKLLKDQKVIILDAPQNTEISHCQYEWSRYGTCCDQQSLVSYAEHDSKLIKESVDTFENKLSAIAKSFSDLIDASKEIIRKNIKLEPVANVLINTIFDEETNKLRDFVTNFFETEKEMSLFSCWKQMARIRSNSLCSVCSGRSEVFFAQNDKAMFLSMDCQPMIDSCLTSFDDFVKLIEGVDKFADKFIDSMKKPVETTQSDLLNVVKNLDKVTEAIKTNLLHQKMKEFINLKDSSDERKKWSLCESFITVTKEPYILALKELFVNYKLNPLDEITELMKEKISEEISNHKRSEHCSEEDDDKESHHRCNWKSHSCEDRHRRESHHCYASHESDCTQSPKHQHKWRIQNTCMNRKRVLSHFASNHKYTFRSIPWQIPSKATPLASPVTSARPSTPITAMNVADISNFFGDVQVVPDIMAKVDSSYASFFGAIGTTGNEAAKSLPIIPLNLTMEFP